MTIADNLHQVQQQIEDASKMASRTANSVTLLAVSKAQEINKIEQLYQAGQKLFGESYLSEALGKIAALRDYPIEWHFIGPIQSNKTREIAQHFAWVQSVDRVKIATRLSAQRMPNQAPLNVLAQVNLFGESSKKGANREQLPELLAAIHELDNLTLRGIMSLPPATTDPAQQNSQFREINAVFKQFQNQYSTMDTLSIGMSGDMIAAINQGSTMVRVGTALFGERPPNWKERIKAN
ncbi:MAG: YggS family pyridoxal phosphate-dependent enzyme [Gammaproteobacteria bacterium]|nr:YggS family pyridoxal phosphate-dependent enzyme [Gammaproteobacteria bacterium]